jgi:hypothetical protein
MGSIGWVHVGTIAQEHGGDLLDFMKKYGIPQKKNVFLNISLAERSWSIHFFSNKGFLGFKRRRILRRFQKYQLILVAKCTSKKIFHNKGENLEFSCFFK